MYLNTEQKTACLFLFAFLLLGLFLKLQKEPRSPLQPKRPAFVETMPKTERSYQTVHLKGAVRYPGRYRVVGSEYLETGSTLGGRLFYVWPVLDGESASAWVYLLGSVSERVSVYRSGN